MSKIRVLVSLLTSENDYQVEQALSAERAAAKRGDVELRILYADNDAVNQSTQLLRAIQAEEPERPNAIVIEPAGGTGLPQVARAAVQAGIGWAVLNRDAQYIPDLRRTARVPVFGATSDQFEIGRLQLRQCLALSPNGGSILYIQGPSEASAARERALGFHELKPSRLHVTTLKGQWTEESATRCVRSWLKLSTSQKAAIDLIVAQNDAMAMGARKAFETEVSSEYERERWLSLPYLGVDGVPKTGQAWVREGLLTATILMPPTTGQAIEILLDALRTGRPPAEKVFAPISSIPALETLKPVA